MPKSLWAATTPELDELPTLGGSRHVDVVIVGAGFMGLAAALRLAEHGASVAVLEAARVGWGASGRNNGLLTAGLKRDPHEVRRLLGDERAERLLRFSGDAPSRVVELIETHDIQCDLRANGWIQPAHSRAAIPTIERRVRDWQELGAAVDLIATENVAQRLGTDYYAGAWYDPRGGSLNPLAYARGLARAANKMGAQIYERSPVLALRQDGGKWSVTTSAATIKCDEVLCCTNAYNDGIAALRGSVMPLRTAQIASTPLPDGQARTILPGGESASDTLRLLTSFRITRDKRLIMGGASATAGDETPALFAWLRSAAAARFPELRRIEWQYGWSGYLALTNDHLPQLLKVDDGILAGIGCNGRGIAMASVTGECLADRVLGQSGDDLPIPLRTPRRVFGFAYRRAGVALGVIGNRIMDVAERRLRG